MLWTICLLQMVAGEAVVPVQTAIPVDDSFQSLVTNVIVCPENSFKRTPAIVYGELLAEDRERLNFISGEIYDPARPRSPPSVAYPFPDWQNGIEGFASVAVLIDSKGDVVKVETVCATNERFEAEALKAAVTMHYHPASFKGKAVPDIAVQPFKFNLH